MCIYGVHVEVGLEVHTSTYVLHTYYIRGTYADVSTPLERGVFKDKQINIRLWKFNEGRLILFYCLIIKMLLLVSAGYLLLAPWPPCELVFLYTRHFQNSHTCHIWMHTWHVS